LNHLPKHKSERKPAPQKGKRRLYPYKFMSDEVEFIFGAEKVALIENRPISVNECYRDLY